ncbi:MAG: PilZ domain-containing protein [Acidobacteria bacterium]|nr:PilZ domain-containing protein [Acidobacteriota bacterium]
MDFTRFCRDYRTMQRVRERRKCPRFPHALDMRARALAQVGSAKAAAVLRGRVQNLSRGGVCVLSDGPVDKNAVVICEIALPDLPLLIPTVMQVRWDQKREAQGEHYLVGLQFLL